MQAQCRLAMGSPEIIEAANLTSKDLLFLMEPEAMWAVGLTTYCILSAVHKTSTYT